MSTDKVLELERERDAWEKLAREEGRAKLDYLYDAAMLQAKVDELQAELAEPCDCGTLTAQLAEANQRAGRLIKDRDDWRRRYGMAQEVIKESAGVLPEGAVCFVPDGGKGGKGGKGYPMKGDYYMDHDGSVIKAECNHREVTYPIMVPWHPPKAEPEKPERELYTVPDPEPGDKLEWECEGVTNDGQFWIGLVDGFVTEAVANRAVEILNTHFAEPPKAESGEGDEYAQDPDAGTLASELCRIADSIGRNDCTRSWAEKFIYSIVDELPPAIASHVMRPPITEPSPKAPAASEEGIAGLRETVTRLQGELGTADKRLRDIQRDIANLITFGNGTSCTVSGDLQILRSFIEEAKGWHEKLHASNTPAASEEPIDAWEEEFKIQFNMHVDINGQLRVAKEKVLRFIRQHVLPSAPPKAESGEGVQVEGVSQIDRRSDSWRELIEGDLRWLGNQPRTLERDHIELIVKSALPSPKAPAASEEQKPFESGGKWWKFTTGEWEYPKAGEHFFHDPDQRVWKAEHDYNQNQWRIVVEVPAPSAPPAAEVGGEKDYHDVLDKAKEFAQEAVALRGKVIMLTHELAKLRASQPPVTAKGTQYVPDITDEMQAIVAENKAKQS